MYLKRELASKTWPVPRKGTTYLSKPSHNLKKGIPLVIITRELLKLVRSKKELQKLLNEKQIEINGKLVRNPNYSVLLFDSIGMPKIKKYYRVILKDKKINVEEISEKDANMKPYQLISKKMINKDKIQLNLNDGKNILADGKSKELETDTFILLDNTSNKIIKTIPLEKGVKIVVIKGKHAGLAGELKEISQEGKNKIANIKSKEKEVKVNINNLFISL